MSIDNREVIATFIDEVEDGDTFWYTELLDRTTNGSSRFKMLRSFEHNSRAEFLDQCDTIAKLCEQNNVRAYIRLSPRSRKQVAHHMLRQVTDQVLDGHYDALWHTYGSSCGKTSIHGRKLWLWDIDEHNDQAIALRLYLATRDLLRAVIPSRAGYHLITPGFDMRAVLGANVTYSLHKDNPTNLYIPQSAR